MRGRIFGVKKSILLWATAIIQLLIFIGFNILLPIYLKIPDLWFYAFCICLGIYELVKSVFFRLDSSIYIGSLLCFIGISGFIFWLTKTVYFAPIYILSAFSLASLLTYIFCKQRFHLILCYSLLFVDIFLLLLLKSLITLPIFIAFVVPFLVLLILEIVFFIKRRN